MSKSLQHLIQKLTKRHHLGVTTFYLRTKNNEPNPVSEISCLLNEGFYNIPVESGIGVHEKAAMAPGLFRLA